MIKTYSRINGDLYVDTGEIKTSKIPMYTDYVYSCTVLGFIHQDGHFLAHADMANPKMKKNLIQELEKIDLNTVNTFHIWRGEMCTQTCDSVNLVVTVLTDLNISPQQMSHKIIKWDQEARIP